MNRLFKFIVIFTAVCVHSSAKGANILVLSPFPSFSHQAPLLGISRALAARGHNVTVITCIPSKKPIANHTEIDVSESFSFDMGFNFNGKLNTFMLARTLCTGVPKLVEFQLKSSSVQNFMSWGKDVKFDVALYEKMYMSAYLSFIRYLGAPPVIAVSTLETTLPFRATVGSSLNLAYAPVWQGFTDHMTFSERVMNVVMYWWFVYHCKWVNYRAHDRITREIFGEGYPTSEEMEKNVSLLMHTASGAMFYPHSLTPNVVKVGGTNVLKPKPLPEDLEKWISGAENGVIYFSLGSIMRGTYMPVAVREAFLIAFSRLKKYRVLWKWESDQFFPGQSDNVMFKKWIPQGDVLAHPKVKLFITHGGLQSMEETVYHGVPVVCIPLATDQYPNVRKIVSVDAGVSMDYDYLDSEVIFKALNEVLHDPMYRNNMKRLSDISRDTILTPQEQAVWWVEYVIRHNGSFSKTFNRVMYPEYDRITREVFGECYPTAEEMEKNVSLQMHCASGFVYYPHSLTPNVVKVGATHIVKPKKLPEELEKWVSGAKDGVIYFSLGTNMQGTYMPIEIREAFLNAFAWLKNYRVIWKWESDQDFPGQSENVRFKKCLPQQDLLAHPKVKAFITQGGLQSCEETVHFGVPVVGIPLFSDQYSNIRKLVSVEAAVSLDYHYLDTETIYKALDEVLHNPKYKTNIKRLSVISKDTVLTPLEQAVWWVEYVIRHNGARHLRPASLDLHWTQYYLVDVAVFLIFVVCVVAFGVFKLGQYIYRRYLLNKLSQMVNGVKHKEKEN